VGSVSSQSHLHPTVPFVGGAGSSAYQRQRTPESAGDWRTFQRPLLTGHGGWWAGSESNTHCRSASFTARLEDHFHPTHGGVLRRQNDSLSASFSVLATPPRTCRGSTVLSYTG